VAAAVNSGELRSIPVAELPLDRRLRGVWSSRRALDDNSQELLQIARSSVRNRESVTR
jgi:hypothetical protein